MTMKRPVTIKDLAHQLNVSVSTVSRALRNAPDVNPATKKDILELAAQLHYQPNYFAQSLVKKKTGIIGVIVPSIHSNYFSEALSGMTDLALEQDCYLMICQSNENVELEKRNIKKLMACNVDGILISVSQDSKDTSIYESIRDQGIPLVMFDRIISGFDCSKVIVDEYEGAFRAVEHLIKKGCKRIAHLAGPKHLSVSLNRKQGYLDALAKHKLPVHERLIVHSAGFEEHAIHALRKILQGSPLPDGIFFVNDLSAVAGIKYLRNKGIRVPADIRVIGFNNDPVSEVVEPALTTVMQPGYEVGKLSMGVLIDEINSDKVKHKKFELRTKLLIRQSSK